MIGGFVQRGDSSGGGPEAGDDSELQVIHRGRVQASHSGRAKSSPDAPPGRTPARQRQLTRIVAAAIAGCALILVAAAVARLSRSTAAAAATTSTTATATATPTPTATATPTSTPTAEPATGNLILVRPAVRGYVWLDGKKVTSTSAAVGCGLHEIKVGSFGKVHAITVPCGGDLKVWH